MRLRATRLTSVGPAGRAIAMPAAAPVEDLILFDSTAGGNFSTAFDYPSDATLTVNSGSIAFANTGAAKNLRVALKGQSGAVLHHGLSHIQIDVTVQVSAYPAVDIVGAEVGFHSGRPTLDWFYGTQFKAHPATTTSSLYWTILTGYSPRRLGSSGVGLSSPATVVMRIALDGASLVNRYAINGGAEINNDMALTLTATSDELPRLFSDAGGITLRRGTFTVTAMKVTAPMSKNAPYFLVGDSITQGRHASTYADGWGMRLRTANPNKVVISAAPSATALEWSTRLDMVLQATPRRVFIMLGVNDIGGGATLSDFQTRMNSILSQLDAASIPAVLCAITPTNSAPTPSFNAWMAGLGRPYIDTYTPLATGNALNATYSSGDGIHPNSAGMQVIANTVQAAITANGW